MVPGDNVTGTTTKQSHVVWNIGDLSIHSYGCLSLLLLLFGSDTIQGIRAVFRSTSTKVIDVVLPTWLISVVISYLALGLA